MIDKIIEASLRQRPFVLLAAVALLVVGLRSASQLPIDAVPDITNIQVQINTEVPALAPEEIEKLVTFPLEIELAGVPGMTEMRSLSKFGLSQVTLIFADNTNIYRARQLVSERIQRRKKNCHPACSLNLRPSAPGLARFTTTSSITHRKRRTNRPPAATN